MTIRNSSSLAFILALISAGCGGPIDSVENESDIDNLSLENRMEEAALVGGGQGSTPGQQAPGGAHRPGDLAPAAPPARLTVPGNADLNEYFGLDATEVRLAYDVEFDHDNGDHTLRAQMNITDPDGNIIAHYSYNAPADGEMDSIEEVQVTSNIRDAATVLELALDSVQEEIDALGEASAFGNCGWRQKLQAGLKVLAAALRIAIAYIACVPVPGPGCPGGINGAIAAVAAATPAVLGILCDCFDICL